MQISHFPPEITPDINHRRSPFHFSQSLGVPKKMPTDPWNRPPGTFFKYDFGFPTTKKTGRIFLGQLQLPGREFCWSFLFQNQDAKVPFVLHRQRRPEDVTHWFHRIGQPRRLRLGGFWKTIVKKQHVRLLWFGKFSAEDELQHILCLWVLMYVNVSYIVHIYLPLFLTIFNHLPMRKATKPIYYPKKNLLNPTPTLQSLSSEIWFAKWLHVLTHPHGWITKPRMPREDRQQEPSHPLASSTPVPGNLT